MAKAKRGTGAPKPSKGKFPQKLDGDSSARLNPPGLRGGPPNLERVRGTALGHGYQDLSGETHKRFKP